MGYYFVLFTVSFAFLVLGGGLIYLLLLSVSMVLVLYLGNVFCASAFQVLPTLSYMRFSVAEFMLRSLIHLDLSFGDSYGCICHPVIPTPFFEDTFFYPLYSFSFYVNNQVFTGVWINVRVFNLIPFVCLF